MTTIPLFGIAILTLAACSPEKQDHPSEQSQAQEQDLSTERDHAQKRGLSTKRDYAAEYEQMLRILKISIEADMDRYNAEYRVGAVAREWFEGQADKDIVVKMRDIYETMKSTALSAEKAIRDSTCPSHNECLTTKAHLLRTFEVDHEKLAFLKEFIDYVDDNFHSSWEVRMEWKKKLVNNDRDASDKLSLPSLAPVFEGNLSEESIARIHEIVGPPQAKPGTPAAQIHR